MSALVAAFGLDRRPLENGQKKAGEQGKAGHQHGVTHQPRALGEGPADEIGAKLQQRRRWIAMAIQVSTRLWRGGVVSPSGHHFAPVSGSKQAGAVLMTAQDLTQSAAVLELVKLGPRALPLLLKHLDDPTPTKLTIHHNRGFGAMELDRELELNVIQPKEKTIWRRPKEKSAGQHKYYLSTYQVKVGDICFNIIGQIVGRSYLAVRYQPTAIIIINSPVEDASLAEDVRQIWTSNAPTQHLFHSLLTDYSSRGVFSGFSFAGWDFASDWQCESVMRLLYYFPQETAPLIAKRLHHLKIQRTGPAAGVGSTEKEMAVWEKRELANGLRTDEFVKAVSWCPDPRIQMAIVGIAKRTGDPDIMAAAIRGIPPSQRKSLTPFIHRFFRVKPTPGYQYNYEVYLLLEAFAKYWGHDAAALFAGYIRTRNPIRLNSVCYALHAVKTDWDRNVLLPLLLGKRTIPYSGHWTNREGKGKQIPTRVCDAAAWALAAWRPNLTFEMDQPYAQLDRQIQAIKVQIGR